MDRTQEFILHDESILERNTELEIQGAKVDLSIRLTEGGDIDANVEEFEDFVFNGILEKISGTTDKGEEIVLHDVYCNFDLGFGHISVTSFELICVDDWNSTGQKVDIVGEVLGFQYRSIPRQHKPGDSLKLLERKDTPAGGGNYADWTAKFVPFDDYEERVTSIRRLHNLVRTGSIDVSVEGVYGDLRRVASFAIDRWGELTWILAFIQGTIVTAPRFSILDKSGEELLYTKAQSVRSNIGSSCSNSDLLIYHQSEIPAFLEYAYDRYIQKKDNLPLNEVIGYYVDSSNERRPVEPRFVSLCIGLEMLANRFADDQGCTEAQIELLIDSLGVSYEDLISSRGSFPTEYHPGLHKQHRTDRQNHRHSLPPIDRTVLNTALPDRTSKITEYFWYKSRNHVIHGGSKITHNELYTDYEALKTLTQRILREIFVGDKYTNLHGLKDLSPNEFSSFSD